MALLGQAALAMWWNMAADKRAEFEDWHSHEHYPERLSVPGFRRACRWSQADGGEGIFQMYELENHAVVSSPAYMERLNNPTPWSTQMMPHHRDMVRSQCKVLFSAGGGVARHALTVRLSPREGHDETLQRALQERLAPAATTPGLVGAHLLLHERPNIAQTREQAIRGGDHEADWVLVTVGYDLAALETARSTWLSEAALTQLGAQPGSVAGLYTLCQSATPVDVA